ncbi:MAG: hypothetical protein M3O62_13545 [Pseudomonadota bacterium]|nr:hypothetical protein [Pseudomonadota bacterium]
MMWHFAIPEMYMSIHNRRAALGLALIVAASTALGACQGGSPMPAPEATPVAGFVTDVPAFEQFVATQPTPIAFKLKYPDVTLILPGQMATKELRGNNSRYFATLDEQGRITGGKFQ